MRRSLPDLGSLDRTQKNLGEPHEFNRVFKLSVNVLLCRSGMVHSQVFFYSPGLQDWKYGPFDGRLGLFTWFPLGGQLQHEWNSWHRNPDSESPSTRLCVDRDFKRTF